MKPSPALRVLAVRLRAALAVTALSSLVAAQSAPAPAAPPSASLGPPPAGDLPAPDPQRPLGETLTGGAKQDYEAAVILYKSGDFAGAERRFSSAYATSKDVRLLWNAAACEQALRHYAKAIALVRLYLSSRSPLITAEAERNARTFLDAAVPLTARLIIESNEPRSSVYLDGELLGSLPLTQETRVDFGTHRLTARKPNFTDHVQEFTVTSSADVRLKLKLDPAIHQGRLVVRAGKGDSIAIDGHFRALSTFDGIVPSGQHRLRVTASGSRPFEATLLIEDERTRAVDVTLEAAPVMSGIPTWAWLAGGAAALAGAGTAAYFMFRSPDSSGESLPSGSAGKVQLPRR